MRELQRDQLQTTINFWPSTLSLEDSEQCEQDRLLVLVSSRENPREWQLLGETNEREKLLWGITVKKEWISINQLAARSGLEKDDVLSNIQVFLDNRLLWKVERKNLIGVTPIQSALTITNSAVTSTSSNRLEVTGVSQPSDVFRNESAPIRILFLAANPADTTRLRLDEEVRAIDQALRQSEFRDKFEIKQHWAVRVADIQGYLLRHKPDIVHFSGHGTKSNEIILEEKLGNSHPVPPRALSRLFSVLKDNIRCVVLNACYSEKQADAIAKHIDCVIGMSKSIGDSAAIAFATAFYQALGYGQDVKTAFDLGCVQIDLESLNEQDTPKLLMIRSNPEDIVFVRKE
jgi:hypothetical protein